MLLELIIKIILVIVTIFLGIIPTVDKLPTILGINLDDTMVSGMGFFNTYVSAVWVIHDVFVGFIFLVGYYSVKLLLRLFLGHRAPQ